MNLMERFADPAMIHDLSVGEKLIGSGVTTLMGMGITFVVLFFLWGCIALMARIMNRGNGGHPPDSGAGQSKSKRRAAGCSPESAGAAAIAGNGASCAAGTGCIDQVARGTGGSGSSHITAAIITAAVIAYENTGNGLVVRSIRRMPEKKLWAITAPGRTR